MLEKVRLLKKSNIKNCKTSTADFDKSAVDDYKSSTADNRNSLKN